MQKPHTNCGPHRKQPGLPISSLPRHPC